MAKLTEDMFQDRKGWIDTLMFFGASRKDAKNARSVTIDEFADIESMEMKTFALVAIPEMGPIYTIEESHNRSSLEKKINAMSAPGVKYDILEVKE